VERLSGAAEATGDIDVGDLLMVVNGTNVSDFPIAETLSVLINATRPLVLLFLPFTEKNLLIKQQANIPANYKHVAAVLNQRHSDIDTVAVLKMLPPEFPLASLAKFLQRSVPNTLHKRRTNQIVKNLSRMHNLRVKAQAVEARKTSFQIDRDTRCACCDLLLGRADAVFCVVPRPRPKSTDGATNLARQMSGASARRASRFYGAGQAGLYRTDAASSAPNAPLYSVVHYTCKKTFGKHGSKKRRQSNKPSSSAQREQKHVAPEPVSRPVRMQAQVQKPNPFAPPERASTTTEAAANKNPFASNVRQTRTTSRASMVDMQQQKSANPFSRSFEERGGGLGEIASTSTTNPFAQPKRAKSTNPFG
jgi:hypothetical protein